MLLQMNQLDALEEFEAHSNASRNVFARSMGGTRGELKGDRVAAADISTNSAQYASALTAGTQRAC